MLATRYYEQEQSEFFNYHETRRTALQNGGKVPSAGVTREQ